VFTFTTTAPATFNSGFKPAANPDWLETVKVSARTGTAINIAYDDAVYTPFTPVGTVTVFTYNLRQLFSVSP
jgi:hypothetical protein